MRSDRTAISGLILLVAALILLAVDLPLMNDWLFRTSTLVMLAVSWNMMASAGMISLGHSAFWGLGSYVCLLVVNRVGAPFGLSFAWAFVFGAVAGASLALCTGRLRGVFFAMATLALSEGLRIVAVMLPDLTGGAAGLFIAQAARPRPIVLYSSAVIAAAVAVLSAFALSLTRVRYAMRAMRDNEDAAEMLGINPLLYRTLLCALAGAMAACAGGLNVWHGGYLAPEVGFTLHYAILAQIACIIGGVHTLAGPVLGALMIVVLSEVTRLSLGAREGYSLLVYGVFLVAAILFLPRGLYGLVGARR